METMITVNLLQDFITITLGIIWEVLPFVTLGILVATAARYAVSLPELLARLPKKAWAQRLVVSLAGVPFPVCECGNVPVTRTLIGGSLPLPTAVTFLLAAPIINPVVFFTTNEAFARTFPQMVWLRMAGGLLIAQIIGYLLSLKKNQENILVNRFREQACGHVEHRPNHRFIGAMTFFQSEFIGLMTTVIIGSAIAAGIQTLLPREVIVAIGSNPMLSIVAMILLAFLVSICSSVDAFFALAFVGTMPFGAIAAFLIFGPMMDIKMFTLLRSTFKTRWILVGTVLLFILAFAIGILFNTLFPS